MGLSRQSLSHDPLPTRRGQYCERTPAHRKRKPSVFGLRVFPCATVTFMRLVCSECSRTIGPMLNRDGQPRLFKCPHSGRVAEAVEVYAGKSLSAK